MTSDSRPDHPGLARRMGLFALIVYGVGDMLGSGIYALVGKVAGTMGNAAWSAFLFSMLAAGLTALSYAVLGSRHPRAAGAAYVTQRAFHLPLLTYMVGLAVLASGLTSMATQGRAFAGYFIGLFPGVSPIVVVIGFIALLTLINLRGIQESALANLVCTLVEVAGLLIVIAVGYRYLGSVNYLETPPHPEVPGQLSLTLILHGSVLSFFAFVGFEDMINVTEEVKDPHRNFPRAVIISVATVACIYIAVSLTAVSVVPYAELSASKQPLVDVVRMAAPGFPPALYSVIALFAIANTALINYIMGSRLMYGMAVQGFLPVRLGRIHPGRRTPHVAILVMMFMVLVLVSLGDVAQLAAATSLILLAVFVVVNVAAVILQRRPGEFPGAFRVPPVFPLAGAVVCITMIAVRLLAAGADRRPGILAASILLGIVVLYGVCRPRPHPEA